MTAPTIPPGELGIEVVADSTGRTRTASLRQRYPQRVTMPLHCDPDHPGAATLCVQSPSGGVFSDDELRTVVRCRTGSHLHLTTQAATQVFAGDGAGAHHHLDFTVDRGAVLQYYPGTVIPHTGSTFTQTITVDVQSGGRYLGWEAVAAGRIAHGERYGYRAYDSAVLAKVDGRAVARDRQVIRPGGDTLCLLEGDYLATLMVVSPGSDIEALLRLLRAVLGNRTGCSGGAGRLPGEAGVFIRLVADRAPDLHRARLDLFAAVRAELLSGKGET